jgi:hypothetical protein
VDAVVRPITGLDPYAATAVDADEHEEVELL